MTTELRQLIDSCLASGATWKPVTPVPILPSQDEAPNDSDSNDSNSTVANVHTLSNVPYGTDSPLQSLDLLFPESLVQQLQQQQEEEEPEPSASSDADPEGACASNAAATTTTAKDDAVDDCTTIYIHIHGGGWSRGRKDQPFYGGPAVSQNAVAQLASQQKNCKCVAVAPGYRLGQYPEFVHDAAAAVQWVRDRLVPALCSNNKKCRVILSGHSAGGHIASLLLLRHDCFLAPRGIPKDFISGLVLLSGVYDLFQPLRQHPWLDAKNKWFVVAYVWPAFGSDETLRREASPLLLLDPTKDTSWYGKAEQRISQILFRTLSLSDTTGAAVDNDEEEEEGDQEQAEGVGGNEDNAPPAARPSFDINTLHLPPTLILNAAFDMGLQENGELMAQAMSKHTQVKYRVIPKTDHASICWNAVAAAEVRDFVQQVCSDSP